jgi:hypothetical protein
MKQPSIAALVLLIVACSTPSSVPPLTIPLQYKTMASAAEFPTLPPCAALSKTQVRDAREEKTIGKRFAEGKSAAPAAAVTTTSDVPAWVASGLESAIKRSGIASKASAPLLVVTIDQIATTENVLHRAGYEARVGLAAELRSASGASCWKGHADGSSENYGYAGSTENYQETLNHDLDRAIIRILGAAELKKAICSCGGA